MTTMITVIHVMTCFLIILLVLIQSGKGAEISASFGGSSQTVFGSSGGANFFVRLTQGAAAVFFMTSLALTVYAGKANKSQLFSNKDTRPVHAGAVVPSPSPVPSATAPTGR